MRRDLVVGIGWLVAVGVAALVGVATISALADAPAGLGTHPVSEQQVLAELSSAPGTPATGRPAGSGPPGPAAVEKVVASPAGSALARCAGGQVTLLSWTPASGYRADEHSDPGPADQVAVRFTAIGSGHHAELTLVVVCQQGVPAGRVVVDS